MHGLGSFAEMAMRRQSLARWLHARRFGDVQFGGEVDLDTFMRSLNQQIGKFDVWVTAQDTVPLGTEYFSDWRGFLTNPPGPPPERPGWFIFFDKTHPSVLPGQSDPGLWALTSAYEEEFIRFYDRAVAAGASPPMPRPSSTEPPVRNPIPFPPARPSPETKEAKYGVGVLILLGGAALILAGRQT